MHKLRGRAWLVGALAIGLGALGTTAFVRLAADNGPSMVATVAPLPDSEVQPLVALNRATEAVAKRITPSVVEIQVVARESQTADQSQLNQIPPQFRQFFGPQQPQIEHGEGSGVIISPDGYIVTNNHVVQGATQITVTTSNEQEYPAKVIGTDPLTDLAVIKVDASGLPSAPWGDSSAMHPGDTVLAFGNPLGMNFTVTRGIISALNRSRNMDGDMNARGAFIQTDASINPGNSGGPLVNVNGEVIGINAEIMSESGGSAGIGFAIPSNLVRPTAEQLMRTGKVVRGYLGVTVTNVLPDVAKQLGDSSTQGALVNQVNPGSPAANAGLRVYDVVTAINGQKVTDSDDLQTMVGADAPGTTVKLDVLRNGQPQTVTVTLGNLADANGGSGESSSATPASGPSLGIEAAPLNSDARQQFNIPDSVNGVVVAQVTPGSPADNAGVQPGDVIEQANRHAVTSIDGLKSQLSAAGAGNDVLLLVWHQGNTEILTAHLGK